MADSRKMFTVVWEYHGGDSLCNQVSLPTDSNSATAKQWREALGVEDGEGFSILAVFDGLLPMVSGIADFEEL